MPRVPAEHLKMQVTENSRYGMFGESGWRGSIRLVKLVSKNPVSAHNLFPGAQIIQKSTKNPNNDPTPKKIKIAAKFEKN